MNILSLTLLLFKMGVFIEALDKHARETDLREVNTYLECKAIINPS